MNAIQCTFTTGRGGRRKRRRATAILRWEEAAFWDNIRGTVRPQTRQRSAWAKAQMIRLADLGCPGYRVRRREAKKRRRRERRALQELAHEHVLADRSNAGPGSFGGMIL